MPAKRYDNAGFCNIKTNRAQRPLDILYHESLHLTMSFYLETIFLGYILFMWELPICSFLVFSDAFPAYRLLLSKSVSGCCGRYAKQHTDWSSQIATYCDCR